MPIVGNYNGIPVEQYPSDPYYKVDITNKDEKEEFDSQFKELKKFGEKLKKELEKGEKSSKIYIDQSEKEEAEFENGKFR